MGRFLKRDGLCTFFIVKGYQNLIIVQINRIDERIHQRLPLVFQAHVQFTEAHQPETDKFLFDFWLCQLFFRNAGFKLTLGFFQLLQPLLGGTGQDSSLNRIQHILDTRFCIPELFLIERKVGVLSVLQLHDLGDNGFHGGIVYAYELARQTGKRAIFTERVDNVMTLKRFAIHPGEKCLIAEDVVTTGISSLETKRVIEEAGGVCLGITCVVDRTKPEAPSPIPIVASALKLDLPNYAPEECPICKEGKLPLVHLGSRKMKQEAKQTL